MPKLSHLFLTLTLASISASLTAKPAVSTTATIPPDTGYVQNNITPFAYNTGEWTLLGVIQTSASPYDFYYYKLFQVNATNHRYASIYEVSVQADANYFAMQATYRIRVDKYEVTTGRFDGMEISCISGNPHAAVFYVYNNELWIRATNKWGSIYYRTVADFTGSSPLAAAPFSQTTTAPAGYLTSTSSFGLKCDFDNNKYYQLSYQDVMGHQYFRGNINLLSDATTNYNAIRGTNSTWLLGWNGTPGNEDISVGTQDQTGTRTLTLSAGGFPRLKILANGNVGIGTATPGSYKLAVDGSLGARKIKVTQQTNWADFVFKPDYQLRSLPELETFIKKHQHLPDIPSAEEVQKEGIDLGEMDRKLLQKIEELSLYIIEQDKRIKALESRLEAK